MKRNFSTSCRIRLLLNIYELETSLFFRVGICSRECFSLCCFVTLDHAPSPFPFSLFSFSPIPDCPKKRSCQPLVFHRLGTIISISSPFHLFFHGIRQVCSNLRFPLKVTESPLAKTQRDQESPAWR